VATNTTIQGSQVQFLWICFWSWMLRSSQKLKLKD